MKILKERMTDRPNEEGVCKTALATPGLLIADLQISLSPIVTTKNLERLYNQVVVCSFIVVCLLQRWL